MTHEGQGVGRIDNFTVFVDGAVNGETVETLIIKVNKSFAVGKLMKILKTSSGRVEPFCSAYKQCGGCNLQHMSYESQLEFKTNIVRENIKRIGKIEDIVVHETIGMDTPLKYRNKAQYPVGFSVGKIVAGFYAKRTHRIIGAESCDIQDAVSDKVREIVRQYMEQYEVSAYDETSGKGLVRHVVTRVGFKTGEVMVVIAINGKDLPARDRLVDILVSALPEIKSIYININTQNTNVILGEKNIKAYGLETITDYIGKYKFKISPLSFFQVNPVQTEVLYGKAMEYAALTGNETVFDIYCGIGTISIFLSEKALKVYGVEVVEDAVRDARENARINEIGNIEFHVGEAEKVIPEIYGRGIGADVVVVDPPRKGCDEVLLDTLVKMQPERIVYVSCSPSTLARDLKYLSENGYRAVEVQPVDMFPHTYHVECVVLLTNVTSK